MNGQFCTSLLFLRQSVHLPIFMDVFGPQPLSGWGKIASFSGHPIRDAQIKGFFDSAGVSVR
jgi:hypothetical protein